MVMNSGFSGWLKTMWVLLGVILAIGCTSTSDHAQPTSARIDPVIVAVSTPGTAIPAGAAFSWLPQAVNLYRDERLDNTTIQYLIEKNIRSNLADMGFRFVEHESAADYTVAYTAALESSLDDATILQRFGLLPGNMRVPEGNPQYEKGTLLIYALDNRTGDVLWRSAVQAAVDFTLEDNERKDRIEPIVRDMFASFPVAKQ